jgi:isopentenyl-diphosphate delta-isomerase
MTGSTNSRKLEHVQTVLKNPECDLDASHFESVELIHRALPECDFEAIDTSTVFLGKPLSFPLIISSMTGGNDEELTRINRNLATAAEACGIAMGVGSQRIMIEDDGAKASFALRDVAPNALLCANLGAVQLNDKYGLEQCQQAIDALGADALYLHLNPLQEAVQQRGNRDFSDLAEKIGTISRSLGRPVIIKEVGCGISPQDAKLLLRHNVRIVDVAGQGGTSWSRIEQLRRDETDDDGLGYLFSSWGIPTPACLEILSPFKDELDVIASGGIRNGLDMAKALILGARLCGIARPFLAPAKESAEAVITLIERLKLEFRTAMFLLGQPTTGGLRNNESLLLETWTT